LNDQEAAMITQPIRPSTHPRTGVLAFAMVVAAISLACRPARQAATVA